MTENRDNDVEQQFTIRMIGIQQGASQENIRAETFRQVISLDLIGIPNLTTTFFKVVINVGRDGAAFYLRFDRFWQSPKVTNTKNCYSHYR